MNTGRHPEVRVPPEPHASNIAKLALYMPSKLSILVFVASPLDDARYRHTALYFEFDAQAQAPSTGFNINAGTDGSAGEIRSSMMEVVGSTGFFSFSERVNAALPVEATGLARAIFVSCIPDTVPVSSLRATVSGTPIADGEGDWNSQNWVGDALGRLVTAGYLEGEARDQGLEEMVNAVLEATDEAIA
ncbi:uncharacterized protein N7482_009755 [Penicillium canariense]|uniref:Uncharacterized protein n=1 Tax=Penicillium canariense TaxID=189055 RepID=A0A9W9LGC7_9EURO|nr:uncharacterized protein N7482_009755 [Penicillium canariense]KAJ5153277.1 hypothetical protein N7482_009755 [Penicillium canariense]